MTAVATPHYSLAPVRTFLDALVDAIRCAGRYNQQDQTPPAAVLWPDKERQWQSLIPELGKRLPLYVLGAYNPSERTGPAYWLRCIIERTLPDVAPLPGDTPVIYLPGYSRQDVRAIEASPAELQPLAELQYRGALWTQKNGRDWTIAAFLQSADGGRGLKVAPDPATKAALQTALPKLAEEPLADLRRERLIRAPYLDGLLHPDDVRNLLHWLDDPQRFAASCDPSTWAAFLRVCQDKYGIDPERDGRAAAAGRLAQRQGAWETAWRRFAETSAGYAAIPMLLRQAKPTKTSPMFDTGVYPQDNEEAESALRPALQGLAGTSYSAAVARIGELEQEHAERRDWVWAKRGKAPLAMALEHLAQLAVHTSQPLASRSGGAPTDAIEEYLDHGWRADAAVLHALAAVETQTDVAAVHIAIRALYAEWLNRRASMMQMHLRRANPPEYAPAPAVAAAPGTCLLFSDGLRYDLAQELAAQLVDGGKNTCEVAWRMAALPTITATAKPAVSPAADRLEGGPDIEPTYGGTRVTVQVLRRALADAGCQALQGDDLGDPFSAAWTEFGDIDADGHEHGSRLAYQIPRQLRSLGERIDLLLAHGWRQVAVVTDHGWLLLPGGLPKADLPEHLTETRKGRCARMKPSSSTSELTVPWRWDPEVLFAYAPGSACFEAGKEYEHGGISPQECVTPVLTVTRGSRSNTAKIAAVTWKGLRCVVSVAGADAEAQVDLRTRTADPSTSLVLGGAARPIGADGSASLPVSDDHEGSAAVVVVLDAAGAVLTYTSTTVGG